MSKFVDTSIIECARGNFHLYFNTGDLSLSASRESIYIDEKTKKAIKDKLSLVKDEIRLNVSKKVETFNDLYKANTYYKHDHFKIIYHYKILRKFDMERN